MKSGKEATLIFTTAPTKKEARTIASALLNQKKAACVSILPGAHSLFWWEGKIDSSDEVLLLIKTASHLLDDVTALIRKIHSYDVPEVVAVPIIGGNEEYLKWLRETLKQ